MRMLKAIAITVIAALLFAPQPSSLSAATGSVTFGCYQDQPDGYWVHEVWGPGNWSGIHHGWQSESCFDEHIYFTPG